MATFKEEIQNKRADGTYNIRVRVTHNRQIRRISTNLYATTADLTKGLNLKNHILIDQVNAIISQYRKISHEMGFSAESMSIDEFVEELQLRLKGGDRFRLNFMAKSFFEVLGYVLGGQKTERPYYVK